MSAKSKTLFVAKWIATPVGAIQKTIGQVQESTSRLGELFALVKSTRQARRELLEEAKKQNAGFADWCAYFNLEEADLERIEKNLRFSKRVYQFVLISCLIALVALPLSGRWVDAVGALGFFCLTLASLFRTSMRYEGLRHRQLISGKEFMASHLHSMLEM